MPSAPPRPRDRSGRGGPDGAAWHARSPADTLAALGSSPAGLTSAQAGARLTDAGPNRLPGGGGPSALRLLGDQLRSPLILALIAAGALALAIGEREDGIVVLAVVVLNALLGFAQEHRAGQAIAALATLVAEPARVRRDGAWTELPAEDVVPGDVVELAQGERIVADLRVLDASALRAQEAALTGESEPVAKGAAAVAPGAPLAERSSLLYAGTLVAAGSGRGVAVATGAGTELGRISSLVGAVRSLETPLTRDLGRFARTVTGAIGVLAVAVAVVAAVRGFGGAEAVMAAISFAVAAVPEGLPTVVTIALAVGARRMATRRAIVRRLPAVETLGAATVVASDKTGTLTRNRMRVEAAWAADGDLAPLRLAAVLCNDARPGLGDPTETALLDWAGLDAAAVRAAHPRSAALPFDATRMLMATLNGAALYVKGAPEAVLPRCRDGAAASAEVERQTALGRRVLVLATRAGVTDVEALEDLRLLGLVALVDPPRAGARDAVAAFRAAGVRVVMVTGDHPRTARAIGADLGIAPDDVHARVEPEGKLRLVRELQAAGEVVAVTGDGVNDAPALRQADIGVAMGRGGTAAAREAADIVLADDDISTVRAAIEEGRRAYDNLVKALAFVLPTSLGQALIVAVAVAAFPAGRALPITPVQILWINLIVAVALAVPLAFEAPEPDAMTRPPRRPGTPLLDRALLVRTVLVSVTLTVVALGLFELARAHDLSPARAQTTAVTGAVALQALYLLACRSLTRPNRELGRWSNPAVYWGIGIVLALQAAFVFAPFMQAVFGSAGLGVRELVWCAAAAVVVLPVAGWEERRRRRGGP